MKKLFRLVVFAMCFAGFLLLFGCGKQLIVDGPGMERDVWSAFTIARCTEMFEPIYSYTVKDDENSDGAYLYEGQTEGNGILIPKETFNALLNLNLLSLPDEGPVTGNFLGLSVTDLSGRVYAKRISNEMENKILALIEPYLDEPDISPWTEFSLSSSESNTLYCFWFTVKATEELCLVTGACQDTDGHSYEEDAGIPIEEETLQVLRDMVLERLPDEEPWPEDLEMPLDAGSITLTLTLENGTVVKKNASGDLSLEIYDLFLPYFQNNNQ